jgi:hypothetical protein
MTDFDPDKDEAIMSTRQMDDFTRRLPRIRDTAKKLGRWAPKPQDFVINTSAIGRAFPDFTQGESSDDSMSFEVARGAKTQRNLSNARVEPLTEYSDNIASSPIVFHEDFNLITTPKRGQPKESILKDALRNSAAKIAPRSDSRKENIPPQDILHSTPVRGSPYISHASRTSSNERKTLAELHARVTEESDGSFIDHERPATVTLQPKNTRFCVSTTQPRQKSFVTNKHPPNNHATEKIRANSASSRAQSSNATNSTPTNPTTQSFILPNVPEVSLNAGTLMSPVPVFARGGKVQSQSMSSTTRRYPHEPVDGIAIPDEEEDIYLSLQLMKARVAKLESEKRDDKQKFVDLGVQLDQLRAQKQEHGKRRMDSALGSGDDGSGADDDRYNEAHAGIFHPSPLFFRSLLTCHSVLSTHARSLGEQLDASIRRVSNLELHVESLTAERDSGLKELTFAERRIETLEERNDDLEKTNRTIKDELHKFIYVAEEDNRDIKDNLARKLTTVTTQAEVLNSKLATLDEKNKGLDEHNRLLRKQSNEHLALAKDEYIQTGRILTENQQLRMREKKYKKALNHTKRMSRELAGNVKMIESHWRSHIVTSTSSSKRQREGGEQAGETSRVAKQTQRQFGQLKSATAREQAAIVRPIRPSFNGNQDTINEESHDETTNADTSRDTTIHKDPGVSNQEGDSLELSDIASDDMSVVSYVRHQLRDSRKAKDEILAVEAADNEGTECTSFSVQTVPSVLAPGVLSGILKNKGAQLFEDFTGRISVKSARSHNIDEELTNITEGSQPRRHSDSTGQKRSRRLLQDYEDMTSAFIIPDIASNAQNSEARPALSASARQVLNGLCEHDQKNCTICVRITSIQTSVDTKQTIHVARPVPVSDRMPAAAPYEEEPTLRPSVAPGIALASVIKNLRDEIEHLRVDYSRVQTTYNRYDASMSKKYRRVLKAHLDKTLTSIDRKMDQIYFLYDVLEGQKATGQAMTEEEIEITLQGLSISA